MGNRHARSGGLGRLDPPPGGVWGWTAKKKTLAPTSMQCLERILFLAAPCHQPPTGPLSAQTGGPPSASKFWGIPENGPWRNKVTCFAAVEPRLAGECRLIALWASIKLPTPPLLIGGQLGPGPGHQALQQGQRWPCWGRDSLSVPSGGVAGVWSVLALKRIGGHGYRSDQAVIAGGWPVLAFGACWGWCHARCFGGASLNPLKWASVPSGCLTHREKGTR